MITIDDVQTVNVSLLHGTPPYVRLQRPLPHGRPPSPSHFAAGSEIARVGSFWVPHTPFLLADQPVEWAFTQTGQWVAVPLLSYLTASRSHAAIFGLGIQLGMLAVEDLLRQQPGLVIAGVSLFLGSDVEDLHPREHLRCRLGLALRTEK